MQNTPTTEPRRSRRGLVIQIGAIGTALIMVGLLTIVGSQAAFTASTDNTANQFSSGSVILADDDSGQVMFNLTNMSPGTTATRCINVIYTGSLTADVRLYGTVTGTGLAPYLNTSIDIGTGPDGGTAFSCNNFALGSNLRNDTLAAFGAANTNYGNGLGGYTGATNSTTRSYRVTVTLADDDAAQAKTATAAFVWEAQNT